ncbi:type i restriction-modification system methyltransferase subunit [Halorubrum saccharovorum DSM 1137]|uniref:site-specific DNA-methyltransferase (adenine-specific) n=1 Tax=Halorubrum saccharovorum DSM 1137 TaxID=1227484 RepID=M0DYR6_9EURY|nr:N-6 DNA methylase [Halorubrum saccharovorum]ELZ40626.1 type i restriction-modification system methyltransferase subunit [Halorubrum saccharovorum DSM 1137]
MSDTSAILDSLHGIASRLDADMTEKDVENAFLNENFYTHLGYKGTGHDLRSEWTLPDNRRPDYVTLDSNESVTTVYEFKTTGRDLGPHEDQLFHYVDELKADYGVLTNGEELRLYRRDGRSQLLAISLENATQSDANDLYAALQKPAWDITNPESVGTFLDDLDEVELDGQLGREHFFETFRLEEDSPFANLVTAMMDLLVELRDEQEAKFVKGAYDFWEASYASVPDDTPDSWEPFIDGKQSLRDFMFCLESGHALLSRLLLAKATDDHDFFPTEKGLRRYFDELGGFSGNIDLDAYPVAANGMIEDMRNQLVQSLFEDDIFVWWTDGYGEQTASQHDNPYNRFRDVAKDGSDVSRVSPATRERFSRSIAHVSFAVLKFDFSRIEGDPLGNLYQRYFDPETRKALGEFYTPQPVIEYIMDGVDYDVGVSEERIIDPSCGSGTFLVEAVERYIEDVRRYDDDPDWSEHLTDLCTTPHIVGLDVHPFAVLMAQIRFMVTILPEYREAKRDNEDFTIRRLPIFRTDSLRNERKLTGIDLGDDGQTQMTLESVTEDNQDVKIPIPLPIEVDEDQVLDSEVEDGFLVQRVRMPKYDTVKVNAGVRSFGEYFAALQGVLDVVKYHMQEDMWEYQGGLTTGINRYTNQEYEEAEEFFEPYVDDVLETMQYLREDHGDGRLFKIFEDSILALVVKNYMEYDYVVGNPPYVNIKNIKDSKQDWYKQLYTSAFGRFDLYVLFLERGLEWLKEDGTLGYITSNKFTRSSYGKEIRRLISTEYSLEQYIEFGDVDIFSDATNFASILLIDRDKSRKLVPYAKVHEADEDIFDDIRNYLGQDDILTDSIEVSTYPLSELNEDNWRFTPEPVRTAEQQIRNKSRHVIDDISLGVREGVASGGDESFIVSPEYAEEKELEDSLLWPIVRGKNVRRWTVEWEDELVIYPYNEQGDLVDIDQYPNIKAHLDSHEEDLKDRYCVKKGNKGIYEYHGSHPKSMFEGDFKIATPDMATENHFSFTNGLDCFKNTVYVLTFSDSNPYSEKELLGLLNSSIAEFSIKQTSPPLRGKPFRYRYKSQYVNQIPLPNHTGDIASIVEKIVDLESLQKRIEEFPNEYVKEYQGDVDYLTYKWKTTRKPVESQVEEIENGRYAVTAGRTDEITSALIDKGDENESKLRAEYVQSVVNNRHFESGETISIPVPSDGDGVRQLLDALKSDRDTANKKDIPELESELDNEVYRLFEVSEETKDVIESYLEVF